jgi:hypothetical protein
MTIFMETGSICTSTSEPPRARLDGGEALPLLRIRKESE